MANIYEVITFLGWCSLINMGILGISTLFITVFKSFVINLHSNIMGVNATELPRLYFQYLGTYKIAIIVLNLVPYIALKLIY